MVRGNLTIDGHIEITAGSYGIYVWQGDFTQEGGTLVARTTEAVSTAIKAHVGKVIIDYDNVCLEAYSDDVAIIGSNGIEIKNTQFMKKPEGGSVNAAGRLVDAEGNSAKEVLINGVPGRHQQ